MVALGKERALHLNKLESPSSKDALCPGLFEIGLVFLGKKFLNFLHLFSLYYFFSPPPPLERGMALYLKKKLNPLHPRMICANFG